ncbi:MAG: NAD-glutamate dehydrogenase [Rhizomicrobium sp.]
MTTNKQTLPKDDAAQALLHAARELLNNDDERRFFDILFSGAASEDIDRSKAEGLAALARMAWDEARKHKAGEIQIAILPGSNAQDPENVVVAVNDDRPFLFDSALAAAIAAGARIRTAFHPLLDIAGKPTSVIVLVVDAMSGGMAETALRESLNTSFVQGRDAVRDWKAMQARLKEARSGLAARAPKGVDVAEDLAFLDWLGDNHFTFLGARDYALTEEADGGGGYGRLDAVPGSGLGALSDEEARVIRQSAERPALTRDVRAYLDQPEPLIITKSNARSLVHRRAHMDYVGVKTFDAHGAFNGERRFVGLFTSSAYSLSSREIPLLRQKCAAVMTRAGFAPASHDGKALAHILDTFPRDELFQISEDELLEIAMGILRLGGRPKVKLFLRFDRFDRFVSALVFAPRDHVNGELREKIHALLARALDGRMSASYPAIDESALVRIHYIIGRNQGPRPQVDIRALERQIADAIRTWDDAFLEALSARHGRAEGLRRLTARAAQFTAGYRGAFSAHEAAPDLEILETLAAREGGLKVEARAYRKADDAHSALRLKLYVLGDVLPLSVSLPVFENLGLKVIAEDAFPVQFKRDDGWTEDGAILDFQMERADGQAAGLDDIREPLQDVFHAVLGGQAESDGFNRLVIGAGLNWRDVAILRTVAKFLRQAAFPFSQDYMEQALARNPEIAALLTQMFHARLDPKSHSDADATRLGDSIEAALANVPSLDDDRIIRRFRNVIANILRTNYYQAEAATIAVKLDSARLDDLPAPRPWREIFVYSPQLEGVHLRFGKVARGGIRWSDRREDFRTEILGLVKAQQVKNAVIVPVGAKGGFYPKSMPANPTRDQFMSIGVAAYKMLINALLDVTDNLKSDGSVVPPPDVVRHDGDDPYLVVAADKGTATFSDIANGIAEGRGFWLGDAFASGGSHGYDHKKMGITARGAWEAVKRHFREMGRDIQNEDFTAIGVGDMSGDVFGNGMLLSKHTRLVAAFDHRHIFLDPKGDTAKSFAERQRLFDLPRSSWDDYNRDVLGAGGGIFARSLKEIALTPEVQALIGTGDAKLSPQALIKALLKAKTDLLWFGGIGTFIKSAAQSNQDAGDRANDAVRINGSEVGAKVIGEGANLGVTQLGRVEYARSGGCIDTDAVDNSAGVDTSDHEVNLKILLSGPYRRGEIDSQKRDALLANMTDDVARLVLADNYDQTLALSVAETAAVRDIDAGARFIRALEAKGKLDRAVEFLPGDADIQKLENDKKGFSRPELAVLMAYAKLDLDAEILDSALPDDKAFAPTLAAYFPKQAAEKFAAELDQHRLKREIISTTIANRLVNLAGPFFVARMKEMSGCSGAEVARAFVVAEGAFGLEALKARIDALDGKAKAEIQIGLYTEIAEILRRLGLWFLTHVSTKDDLAGTIALYRAGVESLRAEHRDFISPEQAQEAGARITRLAVPGVPEELARDIGLLPLMGVAPEIAQLARTTGHGMAPVAALYFGVGAQLGLDRIRLLAARISASEHWDRLAIRRLVDDLFAAQRALSQSLLAKLPATATADHARKALQDWAASQTEALERTRSFLGALETTGELSIAKLTLANSQIHKLADI